MASQQPLILSFRVGLFFYLIAQAVHQRLLSLFFFFPKLLLLKLLLTSGKTSKMHTYLHKLFCSVCVAVVHSFLFISKLGSRVCCVRVTSPLQGKSKNCTWRKPQCTKMQGGYGSPFYTSFFVCRVQRNFVIGVRKNCASKCLLCHSRHSVLRFVGSLSSCTLSPLLKLVTGHSAGACSPCCRFPRGPSHMCQCPLPACPLVLLPWHLFLLSCLCMRVQRFFVHNIYKYI